MLSAFFRRKNLTNMHFNLNKTGKTKMFPSLFQVKFELLNKLSIVSLR